MEEFLLLCGLVALFVSLYRANKANTRFRKLEESISDLKKELLKTKSDFAALAEKFNSLSTTSGLTEKPVSEKPIVEKSVDKTLETIPESPTLISESGVIIPNPDAKTLEPDGAKTNESETAKDEKTKTETPTETPDKTKPPVVLAPILVSPTAKSQSRRTCRRLARRP
jgi:hypothetical protein